MPFLDVVPQEILGVVKAVDPQQVEELVEEIQQAKRIFVCGAGRSLLMMKAFAMRLVHLGLTAYVVGETITPAIGEGDLLVAGTGSGQTRTTLAMVEAARLRQARVCTLTAHADSPVAEASDLSVIIPTPVTGAVPVPRVSQQPPGSLFEQALLVLCDSVVLILMRRLGVTAESMRARHTKLE